MLAFIIFALTLFGILRRPFGFGIWVYSSVGAVAVTLLKLVNFSDLRFIFSLIWDSSLTLIALIIISLCLQSLGFFEWLIFYTLKLCQRVKIAGEIQRVTPNSQAQNALNANSNTQNATNLSLAMPNSHNQISANSAQNTLIINAKVLFIALCFLCALCSSVLANDGAILIFTPLVLGLFLRAKKADLRLIIAFLFAVGFVCDSSSNALIISNLTNIITANFYHIGFADFAKMMFLPNLLAFLCALMLFLLVFRGVLRTNLHFRAPAQPKLANKFFAFYLGLLGLFVGSFFISRHFSLPLSVNCLILALILLFILWRKSPHKATNALKNAPFGIIVFVFGLFVVVFALTKTDIQPFSFVILNALSHDKFSAIFGTGVLSAFGASIFNNLPMVLFGNLAINELFAPLVAFGDLPQTDFFTLSLANSDFIADKNIKQNFVYAHLLGCNIGSKLTPIGSLCTLLWLSILAKKGVKMSFARYFAYSLIFTLPVLFAALFGLWLLG